jgi:hypothetical protein
MKYLWMLRAVEFTDPKVRALFLLLNNPNLYTCDSSLTRFVL